jgi:cardiolipin synthase C
MRYFLLVFVLFGCSSNEIKYTPIVEDYCSEITDLSPPRLSEQLAPFKNLTRDKTAVYSLEEGDFSMITRAWLTESAEKSIDIQYFIFSADNIGLIASDFLLRAADRGIKIRIIVDDIMVEADADELLALDAHPNFEIKIYNPVANIGKNLPAKIFNLAKDFKGFNQRMHNKAFIADNSIVITGGRNIADEYFDYDRDYNFRDRDVLLFGKITEEIQQSFEEFWNSALSVPISELVSVTEQQLNLNVKYEYIRQYACNPENFWPEVREELKQMPKKFKKLVDSGEIVWTENVRFISDIPGKNTGDDLDAGGIVTDTLAQLIHQAKSSIYIQSPYLVTTENSRKLFKEAVNRGVTIKILTNSLSSTDNLAAFSGYKRDRDLILETGVKVYEFKPNAAIRQKIMSEALHAKLDYEPTFGLHAKSMVIDNKIAVIGTFNFDPRSINLNTECVTIIREPLVAERLFKVMEVDMQPENAWETTTTFNPDSEAGNIKRIKVWIQGIIPKSIL